MNPMNEVNQTNLLVHAEAAHQIALGRSPTAVVDKALAVGVVAPDGTWIGTSGLRDEVVSFDAHPASGCFRLLRLAHPHGGQSRVI